MRHSRPASMMRARNCRVRGSTGSTSTCSGGPCSSSRPPSRKHTRSAACRANAISWVSLVGEVPVLRCAGVVNQSDGAERPAAVRGGTGREVRSERSYGANSGARTRIPQVGWWTNGTPSGFTPRPSRSPSKSIMRSSESTTNALVSDPESEVDHAVIGENRSGHRMIDFQRLDAVLRWVDRGGCAGLDAAATQAGRGGRDGWARRLRWGGRGGR
jgi:hypothetical protein